MSTKKNLLLFLVVAIIAALGISMISACGSTKYTVTWDISEHATVMIDGFDTLPSEVKEETTLSFTVETETGYEVTAVSINGKSVTADKSGTYNIVVKADTAIKVETAEKINSVTVKKNPDKLIYFAGEELDKTGMIVEVEYGSGRRAEETDYSVIYRNGGVFALGDTSFSVKFKGIESEAVNLTAAVEVKIEIDPANGTIADEYFAGLQANTDLHNLAVSEGGVISFTYSSLTDSVALPTEEQWLKGEEGDYIFVDWGNDGATEIKKSNSDSLTFKVSYKPVLLEIESIRYETQTVGEGDDAADVTFLIIAGKYKLAKTAYLFLREGNVGAELVGDTIGGENVNRGDSFELKFDMRKLVEKGYKTNWMDIRFCATIDGDNEESMQIDLNDYPENFVDEKQIVINGNYYFGFAVYTPTEPAGSTERYLKAFYNDYFTHEYVLSGSVDEDGNPVLTISGSVDKQWAGKTVCIDFSEIVSEKDNQYAVIGEDGSYTVSFNLKAYKLNAQGYAHFKIVESETDTTVVYKDDDKGNLLNVGCINDDLTVVTIGNIKNDGAVRIANEMETAVYYVGKGEWGGIVIYGKNEAIETKGVTLEIKEDKPCLVIHGTYKDDKTPESVIVYISTNLYADIQNNADSGSSSTNADWGSPTVLSLGKEAEGESPAVPATIFVVASDGVWKIYLDLSARDNEVGEVLFSHFSMDGATDANLVSDAIDTTAKIQVTVGEIQIQYRLGVFTGWGSKVVSVFVEEEKEEDEGEFVMAGWGRFISEEKFNKYVEGFKAYCDENSIEYTSISGTYYSSDKYNAIKDFTSKVVADNDVDVIIACADNINSQADSQVKDLVVEKKAIDVKGQSNRMVATLNTCDLNTAFLAYVETEAAKAILAE